MCSHMIGPHAPITRAVPDVKTPTLPTEKLDVAVSVLLLQMLRLIIVIVLLIVATTATGTTAVGCLLMKQ